MGIKVLTWKVTCASSQSSSSDLVPTFMQAKPDWWQHGSRPRAAEMGAVVGSTSRYGTSTKALKLPEATSLYRLKSSTSIRLAMHLGPLPTPCRVHGPLGSSWLTFSRAMKYSARSGLGMLKRGSQRKRI